MVNRISLAGPVAALIGSLLVAVATVVAASPAHAVSFTDWTTVSSGNDHTCGIRVGRLYCWGNDNNGELGNGSTSTGTVTSPQPITRATDWTSVSARHVHTCAIRGGGKLYCWGWNTDGQLGTGTPGITSGPAQVSTASDWTSVTTGDYHTCAIRVGKLYCWGSMGGSLAIGPTPKQITLATDWRSVSAGQDHTCAIRGTGKLYCWGFEGGTGSLGNGTAGSSNTPVQITTATDWRSVSGGGYHTCAIRVGKLYCWGLDSDGQLGNGSGSSASVHSPQQITTATDWKSVSGGHIHTCAIRSAGKLYCWGSDSQGRIGNGSFSTANVVSPQQITTATDWATVSGGSAHTCAIRAAGRLYCWGSDSGGQLGNGSGGSSALPIQI